MGRREYFAFSERANASDVPLATGESGKSPNVSGDGPAAASAATSNVIVTIWFGVVDFANTWPESTNTPIYPPATLVVFTVSTASVAVGTKMLRVSA